MTAQVILSIPTSKKVYRLARLDERIQPTNDPAARRSLSSTSFLCWIYLYEAPAGNAPVKAYGDTFHARHGTFTSSLFQAAPTTLWLGLRVIGSTRSIETSNL